MTRGCTNDSPPIQDLINPLNRSGFASLLLPGILPQQALTSSNGC
jgi:hypothetical protein